MEVSYHLDPYNLEIAYSESLHKARTGLQTYDASTSNEMTLNPRYHAYNNNSACIARGLLGAKKGEGWSEFEKLCPDPLSEEDWAQLAFAAASDLGTWCPGDPVEEHVKSLACANKRHVPFSYVFALRPSVCACTDLYGTLTCMHIPQLNYPSTYYMHIDNCAHKRKHACTHTRMHPCMQAASFSDIVCLSQRVLRHMLCE